jgi:hypothetical protein
MNEFEVKIDHRTWAVTHFELMNLFRYCFVPHGDQPNNMDACLAVATILGPEILEYPFFLMGRDGNEADYYKGSAAIKRKPYVALKGLLRLPGFMAVEEMDESDIRKRLEALQEIKLGAFLSFVLNGILDKISYLTYKPDSSLLISSLVKAINAEKSSWDMAVEVLWSITMALDAILVNPGFLEKNNLLPLFEAPRASREAAAVRGRDVWEKFRKVILSAYARAGALR